MHDDLDWVRRLQLGEDEAWQKFIRLYGRFVPIVSRRLGLNEAEREEVLQEMTLIAFRSIRNLRDPSRLGSWTYTIARRAALNQWRKRHSRQMADPAQELDLDRFPSGEVRIDEILAGREEGKRLRQAVAGLKPACRRLVEDLFLKDPRLSYREISDRYGMPVGSIGPTLARCLRTLRQSWKSVSKEG